MGGYEEGKRNVLFICLGNICRSPIAEAVFEKLLKDRNLKDSWACDSAALGSWHVGNEPDHRALKVIKEKEIDYEHRARKVTGDDFKKFDFIFGMDNENMRGLKSVEKSSGSGAKAKSYLIGDFDPVEKGAKAIVRDPYYDDGDEGFYDCYEQCYRDLQAFLDANP